MKFTDAQLAYLVGQRLGRLATVDHGGAPQNNPVSFRYNPDLGTIDIGGHAMGASRKFRNIAVNPLVHSSSTTSPPTSHGKSAASRSAATPKPSAARPRPWPGSRPSPSASIPTASSASAWATSRPATEERTPVGWAPAVPAAPRQRRLNH
jgi:Pyridoxamine 5'-phosphate oxidase